MYVSVSNVIATFRPSILIKSSLGYNMHEFCKLGDIPFMGAYTVFDSRQRKSTSNSCEKIHKRHANDARSIQRSPLIENPDFLKIVQLDNAYGGSSLTTLKGSIPPPGGNTKECISNIMLYARQL